jgi:hypothetical protein
VDGRDAEPKQYYASARIPWLILTVGIGVVLLALFKEIEGEAPMMLVVIFVLAMIAPWVIWKRRQRPMLTIEGDLLRINTLADAGEEHLLPFSKIASLYITKVEQKTLKMFEYELPWPLNSYDRYGQEWVDAIVIETIDGRQVPRVPIAMFKRRQREEIRTWVGDIQAGIERNRLPNDTPPATLQVSAESPLGITMGELRDTVLSKYGEQVILAIPGGDDSGRSLSIAPVRLWNLDGFLTADFDRDDMLCSLTWESDPSNHITEAMAWQIIDALESLLGQADEPAGRLGWKRRDGRVVRELRVESEGAPYSLWYTEHPA